MDERLKQPAGNILERGELTNKDRVKVYNAEYWMRKANKAKQAEFQQNNKQEE